MTNLEILKTVVEHLSILAVDATANMGGFGEREKGVRLQIADKPWVLSVQWTSGAYSNVGRGSREENEELTFEAALWDESKEDHPWIALTPKQEFSFGVEPMAYATLAEIERAVLDLLASK